MPKVRSKITRGVIEELRLRAKASGDSKALDFLSEVEKTLPKRGRKPGSNYMLDEAIERVQTLVKEGRSLRRASKQASAEFHISVEFLRKEERKRREKKLPSQQEPATIRPDDLLAVSDRARQSLSRLRELFVFPETIDTIEALNIQHRGDIKEVIRSMKAMYGVSDELLDSYKKLIHNLVGIPDWKKIFEKSDYWG
jgi:hypothetical protein